MNPLEPLARSFAELLTSFGDAVQANDASVWQRCSPRTASTRMVSLEPILAAPRSLRCCSASTTPEATISGSLSIRLAMVPLATPVFGSVTPPGCPKAWATGAVRGHQLLPVSRRLGRSLHRSIRPWRRPRSTQFPGRTHQAYLAEGRSGVKPTARGSLASRPAFAGLDARQVTSAYRRSRRFGPDLPSGS